MVKYIHYFSLKTNFEAKYYSDQYLEPWVSLTDENNKVNYNKTQDELLLETPLTFDITEGGNIIWKSLIGSKESFLKKEK